MFVSLTNSLMRSSSRASSRTISTVPSSDALSETTISRGSKVGACAARSVSRSSSQRFHVGMAMLTSGRAMDAYRCRRHTREPAADGERMPRIAVTVVIPVWNAWSTTKACLAGLRSTLGPDDQVIVVDNGSTDVTATRLRDHTWLQVLTNAENRGFGVACNQGAAIARHPVVVFLQNDTLLSPEWLDGLVEPFADATVVATGPRPNTVPG